MSRRTYEKLGRWYFSDETEEEHGPYYTQRVAALARDLYGLFELEGIAEELEARAFGELLHQAAGGCFFRAGTIRERNVAEAGTPGVGQLVP